MCSVVYPSDREAKEMIISIGRRMYERGFVSANDGNITIRVGDAEVWVTPTGVSKGYLLPEMLIKMNFDGQVLEGTWKPTSELAMHLNVYKTDDSIMSTVHAHPLHLSAFACAGIELDLPSTPAASCIGGYVPVLPYRTSGTKELAECVIAYVKRYHVVNLGNHGPISWGKSPMEAWYRMEDAEASCALALKILSLNRLRPLTRPQLDQLVAFHHVDITDEGMVLSLEVTDNQQERGIPFTQYFHGLVADRR